MPAAYPSLTTTRAESFTEEEPEYPVTTGPKFADGGADTFLANTTPVRKFVIIYSGLTLAEATTLDDHIASCYGTHLGFTLTTPTGEVIANVKYADRERTHTKVWLQRRTVRLIKRP